MNCEEFVRSLPDSLPLLNEEQAGHAAACPACAVVAANRRRLAAGLQALTREWAGTSAPARVEARLLASFRGQWRLPAEKSRGSWRIATAWAASAVLTIGMALMLVRENPTRVATPAIEAGAAPAADANEVLDVEAAGFVPLPDAAQISPDEEVGIVRLELPRASVIALGYPMSEGAAASDEVEADVVLGADGLARAVRLLDE